MTKKPLYIATLTAAVAVAFAAPASAHGCDPVP